MVTRLGDGLEATGELSAAARERVLAVLDDYARAMDGEGAEVRTGVLTSAVRDARNGAAFAEQVRAHSGVDARTISGDEEARLTFLGATAGREDADRTLLVVDIGGGSTELVLGRGGEVAFHVSTQVGVVRHSERFVHADPPRPGELDALAADVRSTLEAAVPEEVRRAAAEVVAVAGTPTMAAAMDLGLEPYDADRVEGHVLSAATLRAQAEHLAGLTLEQRQAVRGLHPDRALVIVPGLVILLEVLALARAGRVRVSDHDLLWGRALEAVARS